MKLKSLHLIISTVIVIPVAVVYGFFPHYFFKISIHSLNEHSILKAIMGLYLAFASLWIFGIFNKDYWKVATITNILFMLGLGFGRIISFIFDGITSIIFVFGIFGELFLGFYGMYQFRKFASIRKI